MRTHPIATLAMLELLPKQRVCKQASSCYSTKTTASSQLGETAEQIDAEESNYYSVLENLPEEIRKVAKTSMDNAAKSAEEERNRKFNNAMRTKGISAYEFSQLIKAMGNNVNNAKDAVINYHVYRIRSIIADYNKKTPLPDNNSQTSTGSSAITNDNGNNNTSFADADDEVVAESLLVQVQRNRQEDIDNNYNGDQGAYWIDIFNQQTDNLVNARLETEMKNKGIDENEYKALQSYYMSIVKAKDAVLNMSQVMLEKILEEIAEEKETGCYSLFDGG